MTNCFVLIYQYHQKYLICKIRKQAFLTRYKLQRPVVLQNVFYICLKVYRVYIDIELNRN